MTRSLHDQARKAVVLMVEDNLDHAFLVRAAFEESAPHVELHHVVSGDHCMAWLRREQPYQAASRPDLILLDLHMPRMNGYEVIQEIRKDETLAALVVVVLTTSTEPADVDLLYRLGCNSYLAKPYSFQGFIEMAKALSSYWFQWAVLPTNTQA
jgi:two-component system, chemotaxis family, response regulator Rcp1